jgi:outer membrane receptor protein involved in Fe transport
MIGNGLTPTVLLNEEGRNAIHTRPDQTRNFLNQLTLNGSHWINQDVMLSVNTYYRRSNRNTLNGDANDAYGNDYSSSSSFDPALDCDAHAENCFGVMNRTRTRQNGYGLQTQLAFNQDLMGKKNQFIVGAGYDGSKVRFSQTEQLAADFDASRMPVSLAENEIETAASLTGKTNNWHILATDTLSLNNMVHITASARYNRVKVRNTDNLVASGAKDPATDGDLSGNHSFNRLNPSIGLTLTPNPNLTAFGSYSESSRAPTSIELGCADPLHPCLLPNAMASDPPLKQVVAKTFEFGLRGKLTDTIKWSASTYHAMNHNDIQFVYSTSSMGYFNNVGKTKRQGLDLGLTGSVDKFTWNAAYSYIKATYESDFDVVAQNNSSADGDGVINVHKGNYLPNIPKHQFKLRGQYQATPSWSIGANLIAFTNQFMMGNENNRHRAGEANVEGEQYDGKGKVPGYAIVNLDTQYNIGSGWKIFAKAINVFDKDYATVGRLGESHFIDGGGTWTNGADPAALITPGAPRAGWIGVRYEFGGADKK